MVAAFPGRALRPPLSETILFLLVSACESNKGSIVKRH